MLSTSDQIDCLKNKGNMSENAGWIYDSPVLSDVEAKLRRFLVDLRNTDRIIGIQVCAYKDGKMIINTAAGVLGKDDPRPVQPDSLFPVFSTTKGIAAGMVHWLADKGKLKLDENVANIWPEFGANGKDQIKVNHVLNHTSGLPNAPDGVTDDPKLFCDWNECLKRLAMATPETEPGREQIYHYLSYGWLCGGIVEHASGKKFREVLEEAFARPLNVEGELNIGIPKGVESRLATLTFDEDALRSLDPTASPGQTFLPSSFTSGMLSKLISLVNTFDGRCAIVPGANANVSARALASYYAALVDGGVVKWKDENTNDEVETKIFDNPKAKIHDAFLGIGDYKNLAFPDRILGLGFARYFKTDGSIFGFGHAGLGGSEGYCDINNRFAIGVTLNKMFQGDLTGEIVRLICSELDLPVPSDYAGPTQSS